MKSAARGLGFLAAALAVVVGVAAWLLKDGDGTELDRANAGTGRSERAGDVLATPAAADESAKMAAERAEEIAAPTPAATGAGSTAPTADYLAGMVVDRNGRPVSGAEVNFGPPDGFPFGRRGGRGRFLNFGSDGGTPPDPVKTRTNADGAFRLTKVARGEGFALRVDHPDFVVYRRDDLIVPSVGMELGKITLEPGASVSGQVFGPGGAKVAGAEVSLRDAPDESQQVRFFGFGFGPRGGRKTVTDAEGRFHLGGMPAGKALVVATAKELCEATSPPVELIALQEVGNVVLHLERGHTLTGIVRDRAGKPVAGANVSADGGGDGFARFARMASGEPDAVSGDDGRFTLAALKPGVYEITAEAEGFAPKSVAGIESTNAAPVEITLGASARVSGSVRLKGASEPVRAVQVQLVPYWGEDNPGPRMEMPDAENKATADGAFLLQDVDPGQYRIAARGDGTTRSLSTPFTVEEGKDVDGVEVEVERGAVLTGRVVDAATGAPIENASIGCFRESEPQEAAPGRVRGTRAIRMTSRIGGGGPRVSFDPNRENVGRARTDAEGRFEIDHLSPGRFVIDASHDDYATSRSEPIDVKAAETKPGADLRLGRGGAVEGTVVGLDGKPRAGDRIDVESKAIAGVTRSAVADANGWYRIERVPAGDAVATRTESEGGVGRGNMVFSALVLDGNEGPEPGKRIVVAEGETLRVDFSQTEKPCIDGVVTCSDGPVAGAIVTAMPDGNVAIPMFFGARKEVTTGADGHFRLADLDAGGWRISARHPLGLVPTTASVKLEAGTVRQDFFLEGGVVEGTVVAQKGKAKLAGATVSLERVQQAGDGTDTQVRGDFVVAVSPGRRLGGGGRQVIYGGSGGSAQRVSTDRDGRYRVPWVPAGKYHVTVQDQGYLEARSEEIEVAPNGHVDHVDVELPPAAKLLVHLRSKATGEVLASCPVQLEGADHDSQFGMTDAQGIASFDSLKPGTWTATGKRSWNDTEGQQSTVTCEAERTAEITIDL